MSNILISHTSDLRIDTTSNEKCPLHTQLYYLAHDQRHIRDQLSHIGVPVPERSK
jgi:phage-related holin